MRTEILKAFEVLEQNRLDLFRRLDGVDSGFLTIPEKEGLWSVNQVLTHLSISELGTLRYVKKKMQGLDSLKSRDAFSQLRAVFLKWMLKSSLKFKMPKQLPPPTSDISYEELKMQFSKHREELRVLLESFPEEGLDLLVFKHPFAGRFSLLQTVAFLDHHFSHHLKQIDRILREVEDRGNSKD
ncbi:DinB family protein [Reichenbachiella carrageenanivorans]|uniref:DinB family protein n=1 Tax=Reichenbachiella carrageenanivorans TaxID=2979869 RepID=A0ABY6CYA2_9BACT|nr:DinB family protein [Reichenbachiella carrageenanivorans]UXX78848.1 DinB family protein [Reichenbachiella carrageenanivorans]